jgi:hypothetical protein
MHTVLINLVFADSVAMVGTPRFVHQRIVRNLLANQLFDLTQPSQGSGRARRLNSTRQTRQVLSQPHRRFGHFLKTPSALMIMSIFSAEPLRVPRLCEALVHINKRLSVQVVMSQFLLCESGHESMTFHRRLDAMLHRVISHRQPQSTLHASQGLTDLTLHGL